jgi:hypothetical protein
VRFVVVLYRANGRVVKRSRPFRSKYGAKMFRNKWEAKYDHTYYVEIEVA